MNLIYEFLLEKGVDPEVILNMDSNDFFDMMRYLGHKNTKTAMMTEQQRDMLDRDKQERGMV